MAALLALVPWSMLAGIAVLCALIVVLAILRGPKRVRADDEFPYEQKALLTPAERSFFGALEQAVDGRARVFAKVRIGDVLGIRPGLEASSTTRARNRVQQKHFDFVLCGEDTLRVLAAIGLDDRSHEQDRQRERDAFVEGACRSAQLALLRFPAREAYSLLELRSAVEPVLERALALR